MTEPTKAAMKAARAINSTTFAVDANEPEDIAEIAEIIDRETGLPKLIAALRWYVENDDADETPDNLYWIEGRERAREALRKAGEL